MAKKKIWEFPENLNPQPNLVFLVDENFTTQKLSLSGLTGSDYFSQFLAPVSSGTYDPNSGCITFTTTSGTTFSVCGFSNGTVTGFTYDDKNNLSILRAGLPDLTVNITKFSGLTVNGSVSATNYYGSALNLTGIVNSGTYDNNTKLITFYRNDGPAYYTVNLSNLDINDTYVTGGTLTQPTNNSHDGTINLLYSQDGGNYKLPYTDTFVTGFTYNNANTFTIADNNNSKFSATINSVTGLTVNGDLSVTNNIKTTTLQITSGATINNVLVSDANGNTSWGPRIPDWSTNTTYYTKDLVISLYENEYRLFRALTGFTSSGVSFPGGQTIATDINSYAGQWQEVSPLRGGVGNISLSGSVAYAGTITPPSLSADTNNYNPAGLSTCNFMRLINSTGSNINLTGLKAPSPPTNQAIFICNVGIAQITMPNNSGLSLAANRFVLGNKRVLQNDEGIMLIYDPISSCWRSQAIQV